MSNLANAKARRVLGIPPKGDFSFCFDDTAMGQGSFSQPVLTGSSWGNTAFCGHA